MRAAQFCAVSFDIAVFFLFETNLKFYNNLIILSTAYINV